MQNQNISILCKVVKSDSGEIKLFEIGEFPFSHNPVELQKAMSEELRKDPESILVELAGHKDFPDTR